MMIGIILAIYVFTFYMLKTKLNGFVFGFPILMTVSLIASVDGIVHGDSSFWTFVGFLICLGVDVAVNIQLRDTIPSKE